MGEGSRRDRLPGDVGFRLAHLPGRGDEDQARLAAIRARGAAHYDGLRTGRPASSPTEVIYRDLADHLAQRPLHPIADRDADWVVGYDIEFDGPVSCQEVVDALRSKLPVEGGVRARVRLNLRTCGHDETRRTTLGTSEYDELVQTGVVNERVPVQEQVCRTVYKTETNQRERVLDTGGAPGTNPTLKWVEKTTTAHEECNPVTRYEQVSRPVFEQQTKRMNYDHAFRTITTSLTGTVRVSVGDQPALERSLALGVTRSEESYQRMARRQNGASGTWTTSAESSSFSDADPQRLFEGHVAEALDLTRSLGEQLGRARGDALAARAETARGDDRLDLLLRGAMLGSDVARTQLAAFPLGAELPGRDVLEQAARGHGRGGYFDLLLAWDGLESIPATASASADAIDAPRPARRMLGFRGYTSGFRVQWIGGVLSAGAFGASAPASPVPDHETAAMLGARFDLPLLGFKTERPRGVFFLDSLALEANMAYRTSDAPPGTASSNPQPYGYRIGVSYTPMIGARVGPLGLLVGARLEADMARTGEVAIDGGYSVPLCARLEYRYLGYFMPRVLACGHALAGRDRLTGEVTLPLSSARRTVHLYGRFERTVAGADLGLFTAGGYMDGRAELTTIAFGLGTGL